MPTRLILIAHAPTLATRRAAFADDEALEPLRTRLEEKERFDRLFVAPERRARETAAAFGWSATIDDELRDLEAGAWRSKSFDALLTEAPESVMAWTSDPEFQPPGGESVQLLLLRIGPWIDRQRQESGRVGAIAHPAILRAAIVAALGAPTELFWRIDAGPLARLELRSDGRRWTLRSLTVAG
jgi:broad specificity phosphatase PhoE